ATVLPSRGPPAATVISTVYSRASATFCATGRRSGTSHLAKITTNATPTTVTASPTGVITNRPSPEPVCSRSRPLTTRFVLVPMSVTVPPSTAACDRGISSRDTEMPCFLAHSETVGIITATSGVLLRNPDTAATGTISRSCASLTPLGRPSRRELSHLTAPVSRRPAATTYIAPTVMTPSLPNPDSASSSGSAPTTTSTTIAARNTTSTTRRVTASSVRAPRATSVANMASTVKPSLRDDGKQGWP